MRGQIEYRREQGNLAPRRRPGDKFPIGGAFIGVIVGAILGVRTSIPLWFIVGVIGGGIAGTVIGSLTSTAIMKYQKFTKTRNSE
jgi:hypothetical protein